MFKDRDFNQQAAEEEQNFLIDLIFKPNKRGHKLRPEEIQLLLSYIGEILKEVEAEDNMTNAKGVQTCK